MSRAFEGETFAAAGLPLPRKRRKRATWEQKVNAVANRMVAKLRRQAGINVRLPSHHQPPFRAVPWWFTASIINPGGAGVDVQFRTGVRFTVFTDAGRIGNLMITGPLVPEPFPDGAIGVIARAICYATNTSTGVLNDNQRSGTWSLRKNNNYVPGIQRQLCSSTSGRHIWTGQVFVGMDLVDRPTPSVQVNLASVDNPLLVPVHLLPGELLELEMNNESGDAGFALTMTAILQGWIYPARDSENSIWGTLVD